MTPAAPTRPVTGREYRFPAHQTLVSVTDPEGRIQYANDAFVQTSGYQIEELLGQHHNIVRHPDMPRELFADFWQTLKSGTPWSGLVKNRRANGDHYWVQAQVTPIAEGSRIVGYLSVRTSPPEADTRQAEAIYAQMRAAPGRVWTAYRGRVFSARWWPLQRLWVQCSLSQRAAAVYLLASCLVIGVADALTDGAHAWSLVTALGVMGAVMALWWRQSVAQPLCLLVDAARSVASGQRRETRLSHRVDELGMIDRSLLQAGLNLKALLQDMNNRAARVQLDAELLAGSHESVATRTEGQATALEKSKSAMQEFSLTVTTNATNASEGTAAANTAMESVAIGGTVVGQMIDTMGAVNAASQKVTDIVGVIEGIAFQTNMLALNAAVEAARAGDAGRGFAVVATEVRQLASRSAEAAKQIKAIIDENVNQVAEGMTLAKEAGEAVDHISDSIRQLHDVVNRITVGSHEQSEGITHVERAMGYLESSIQDNLAAVADGHASTQALMAQSNGLGAAVRAFGNADVTN